MLGNARLSFGHAFARNKQISSGAWVKQLKQDPTAFSLTMSGFLSGRRCVSSLSLGRHPSHSLDKKIKSAQAHGFSGLEIAHLDIRAFAEKLGVSLEDAGRKAGELCRDAGITVVALIAFCYFEGDLSRALEDRIQEFREWLSLARAMGAGMIQMPSQFLTNSTGCDEIIVRELQSILDIAAIGGEPMTIAYEPVAFASHNRLWQDAARLIGLVDRKNFKICLDSFHIHALVWADPTVEGGKLEGGDESLAKSLKELASCLSRDWVAQVQISDGSLFSPPLQANISALHNLESPDPRLYWSRYGRPFPGEAPGFFPVPEFLKVVLEEWGWEGWVSVEVFLPEFSSPECGPDSLAARAAGAFESLGRHITNNHQG